MQRVKAAVNRTKQAKKIGCWRMKIRPGDQKLSPATKIRAATNEARPAMVKEEFIIGVALSFASGKNLIKPRPSPRLDRLASSPRAAIMAAASPTSAAVYILAAIIQKTKLRRALTTELSMR